MYWPMMRVSRPAAAPCHARTSPGGLQHDDNERAVDVMARQLDHYHNCQGSGIRSLRDVRAMQRRLRRLDPGRKKSPCLMETKPAGGFKRPGAVSAPACVQPEST